MVMNRPTIFIYTNQPDRAVLKEICAGIEEEGIFFEIFEQGPGELNHLPKRRTGNHHCLTLVCRDNRFQCVPEPVFLDAAFSMRGLKEKRCVEIYFNPGREQCRRLGGNSARAIKRQPLK